MTKTLLVGIALLMGTQAHAMFERISKFKIQSTQQVFEGYQRDGSIYAIGSSSTPLHPSEVVFSTREVIQGIQAGNKVYLRTAISNPATCLVETVFVDGELLIFCDEDLQVGKNILPIRSHFRTHPSLVKKVDSL